MTEMRCLQNICDRIAIGGVFRFFLHLYHHQYHRRPRRLTSQWLLLPGFALKRGLHGRFREGYV